jgi:AGZA family xanthine/uracil permease-like MFS transporter
MGTAARPFSDALVGEFLKSDTWIHGVFSLEQGFRFRRCSSRRPSSASSSASGPWPPPGAALPPISATGIMHSYQWTEGDTVLRLSPAWPFAIAYAAIALIFYAANWITEPADEH